MKMSPDSMRMRLDGREAVGLRAGFDDGVPEVAGVVGVAEDLVAELARVAGAGDPGGHPPDVHLMGEEAEVAELLDLLVDEVGEHLAGARPLELDVGEALRDRLDVDGHAGDDVVEVIEVGVERGDHPAARVGEFEDGAVADHLAVLVAEGGIPDLPVLEAGHVVREDAVGGRERVAAVEVPLAKRRLVPDADVAANGMVLGQRVAEVTGPVPAFPVHELAAERFLLLVERRLDDLRLCAHGRHPNSWEIASEWARSGATAACRAPRSKRPSGPWTPRIARQPPVGSEDRGRDRVQVALALAGRVSPPPVADAPDRGRVASAGR